MSTATATWPQIMQRLQETAALAENQRTSLAGTYLTNEATILGDGVPFDAFDAPPYSQNLQAARSGASSFVQQAFAGADQVLVELTKAAGLPQTAQQTILPAGPPFQTTPTPLYDFMAAASTSIFASAPLIPSRVFTYGTPTYGASNVGTGTLLRLTVDRYGFPLETGFAETLNWTCLVDAQSGAVVGQEQFGAVGQPFRDALTWYATGYGSGIGNQTPALITGVTGNTTQPLVTNPSFSAYTGTSFGSDFVLTGWTLASGSASSMGVSTSAGDIYRSCSIENPAGALKVSGTVSITQTLASKSQSLSQIAAMMSQLAVNFSVHTGTGSVTVQIGSQSWTVNSGVAGWNLLRPSIAKALYFANFDTGSLAVTITITVTSGAGTYIVVDDFNWAPWTQVGGTLWWLIGGQTNFLYGDTIQSVDTETGAIIQRWLARRYGSQFPCAVLPTAPVTAATVALSGTAGVVTAGGHLCWVSYVTAVADSPLGLVSNVVYADGTHKLDWSAIPTGPGGTTKRRLWRSKSGDVGNAPTPYLVTTINDNATTTYADNVADAALLLVPGSYAD